MNIRERLMVILDGEIPDRIPWIPRIDLWYRAKSMAGRLPAEWRDLSLRDVERALFGATSARSGRICEVAYDGVEIVTIREGRREKTEYRTPRGTLTKITAISDVFQRLGLPGRVEKDLLQCPADYKVWEYVVEHTHWKARYDLYDEYDKETGDEGLPMVAVGDVPFHEFALSLAGYNNVFYQLADYPDEIAHLLEVMMQAQRERFWPLVIESPAKLLLWGVHLSSQFTPPGIFERYIAPYCNEVMPMLHAAGKKVAMHADNDTSQIHRQLEDCGWDMLECFVTAPMVPMTLRRAREVWGNRMILWGGIPSSILSPSYALDEFKRYVNDVLESIDDGRAFILGVADNVMPDSDIERVRWISELVGARA